MQLAAQCYTIREYLKDEESIFNSLTKVKEIGYDVVQLSGLGQYRTEWLADVVRSLDLKVCCTHTKLDRLKNELDTVIDEHVLLGTDVIGLGMFKFEPTMASIDEFLTTINPIIKHINDRGLKFVYHNHDHEFKIIEGKDITIMQYLKENTDINFLPDFYWLYRAGVDIDKYLDEYDGRYDETVHLKDCKIVDGEPQYAEIFKGDIDYTHIWQELEQRGVKYAAVEQDNCYGKDPFECLKTSYNNILDRGLIKK